MAFFKKLRENIDAIAIFVLCALTVLMEFICIPLTNDAFKNRMICRILQQAFGSVAVILLMLRYKIKLFSKPQNLLYLLPCLVVAIDNFPFYSYFQGNMKWVRTEFIDVLLFALYCLGVGLFEECIFRGVIFSTIATRFTKDKKGLLKTYVISSVVFGLAHLINLIGGNVGGVILQVGYSTLTGGLFAFALLKTKNIFCAAGVHGIYNFCGLVLSEQGLGAGVVFDLGTGIIMAVISVVIGIYVLMQVYKYSDEERQDLYDKLNIK